MKLTDDFCHIRQQADQKYLVAFNAEHWIYKAHFPNHPVTPGVCIMQIAKEIIEQRVGRRLQITKINNAKFLSIIDPHINNEVWFEFDFRPVAQIDVEAVAFAYNVLVKIYSVNADVHFSKLSLELQ
ncbi:MAG: hypothetical protein LBR17_01995 [Bacteroidales bacterium]|jgi:3-hydroxyacyl-[acyl-carrier-protein] dehydratase|nr:hypothetical protein [Bacteroidales bacterium]